MWCYVMMMIFNLKLNDFLKWIHIMINETFFYILLSKCKCTCSSIELIKCNGSHYFHVNYLFFRNRMINLSYLYVTHAKEKQNKWLSKEIREIVVCKISTLKFYFININYEIWLVLFISFRNNMLMSFENWYIW